MDFHRIQFPIVTNYTLYDSLLTNAGSTINYLYITLDREVTLHDHIEKLCYKTENT